MKKIFVIFLRILPRHSQGILFGYRKISDFRLRRADQKIGDNFLRMDDNFL